MPEAHLLSARLASIAQAGFVPTSQAIQQRLPNLFSLPARGRFTVLDLACGRGDFLAVFDGPRADLYGVEISAIRAFEARRRFPKAFIVHAPYEETAVSRGRVSVGLANFMYAYQDGERTEHLGIMTLTPLLCTDGVLFALLPARSAWKPLLINHLVKFYRAIRLFRTPGEDFARYTQALVVGVKRARPLKTIDEALGEKRHLEQWIYQESSAEGQCPWRGGSPPPELPTTPLETPYAIPTATQPVQIRVMRPDATLLLQYLERSGVHTTPAWKAATSWEPAVKLDQPLVPIEGEAHIAACAMLDMFACEEFRDPEGKRYTFLAHLDKEWVEREPDVEEQREGVIHVKQEQDRLQLSVLNLTDGHLSHYRNDAVYQFLAPWLPVMKQVINERYPALYQRRPARWLVEVTARVGLDGTLPGSSSPGLVREQLEVVWALWEALNTKGHVGLAGEQGVGKTRMTIALLAAFAFAWQHARDLFGKQLPCWLTRLEAAWAANPHVPGERPRALPCLIACPLNVVESVWRKEIRAAWPEAEVIVIKDYTDIRAWFTLCASSSAPAVIALFPQSKTRATHLRWLPAVIRRKQAVKTFDLSEQARLAGGIPILDDRGEVAYYLDPASGEPLSTTTWIERFFCPQCGRLILGHPMSAGKGKGERTAALADTEEDGGAGSEEESVADGQEEDPTVTHRAERPRIDLERLEPVGSLAYFAYKPRRCSCGSPLWTVARTAAVERKHPQVSYAEWCRAMEVLKTTLTHGRANGDETHLTSSQLSGPDLTCWTRRDGRPLVRLAELPAGTGGNGPICMEVPDLAIDRSAPLIEAGIRIGYRLPTGEEVTAIYDLRTRKLSGYVSQSTGNILKKRYGFVAPPADSFSPYRYLEQFFTGLVAFALIDEGHNARNRDTDIGASTQEAQRAAQTYAYGTGTPYGGVLRSFYYEQARLNFRCWQRLGFGWKDSGKAQKWYGFSRVLTYAREIENEAHRGTGRTVITEVTRSTPGLAVSLIPHLFSEWIDFSLDQMGTHLPNRVEIPLLLPMEDPLLEERRATLQQRWQQADMQAQEARVRYDELAKALPPTPEEKLNTARDAWHRTEAALNTMREEKRREEAWIRERDMQRAYREITGHLQNPMETNAAVRVAQETLLRLWTTLPHWSRPPYTLTENMRGEWGDLEGQKELYRLPVLAEDYLYPLERVMVETVAREVAASRPIAVAFLQNGKRNTAQRLQWVLRDFHPWVLSNEIPAMEREQAVKNAVAAGYTVIILPFQRMREGSNLQVIKSVYWAELPPDDLFVLEQFARRFWRLMQDQEVHIYFPVMIGTAAFYTLYRLGMKSAGLSLFLGKAPNSGLARLVGAHKTALARLSAAIAEGVEQEEEASRQLEDVMSEHISEVFEQRNADFRALTQGAGIESDDEIQHWIRAARQSALGYVCGDLIEADRLPVEGAATVAGGDGMDSGDSGDTDHPASASGVDNSAIVISVSQESQEHPWEVWRRREQALRQEQKQRAKEAAREQARLRRRLLQASKSTRGQSTPKPRQRHTNSLGAIPQSLWNEALDNE